MKLKDLISADKQTIKGTGIQIIYDIRNDNTVVINTDITINKGYYGEACYPGIVGNTIKHICIENSHTNRQEARFIGNLHNFILLTEDMFNIEKEKNVLRNHKNRAIKHLTTHKIHNKYFYKGNK